MSIVKLKVGYLWSCFSCGSPGASFSTGALKRKRDRARKREKERLRVIKIRTYPFTKYFQHPSVFMSCCSQKNLTVGPRCPRGPGFPGIPYKKTSTQTDKVNTLTVFSP